MNSVKPILMRALTPMSDRLVQEPHNKSYHRVWQLPSQVIVPVEEALLQPFENLWSLSEWLRRVLKNPENP